MSQDPHLRCPWCGYTTQCWLCPRLAELLDLRESTLARDDADMVAEIDAELAKLGVSPPANDNESLV